PLRQNYRGPGCTGISAAGSDAPQNASSSNPTLSAIFLFVDAESQGRLGQMIIAGGWLRTFLRGAWPLAQLLQRGGCPALFCPSTSRLGSPRCKNRPALPRSPF